MRRPWLFAAACAAVLGACATGAPRVALPAIAGDPQQHQRQRETALAAQPGFSLQGRVALSNGRDGGSGRIEWRQDGSRFDVSLSAPVTRQSWRLSGQSGDARLEGLEGGTRQGTDAAVLLQDATRWEIPVEALAGWVRGMPADSARFGEAELVFGADGRLSRLVQAGWTIDYGSWIASEQGAELPGRLDAVRGDAKVRLIVDRWQSP